MDPVLFHNNDEGRSAFKALAFRAVEWITEYYRDIENFPVRSQVQPGEIYKQLPDQFPARPVKDDDVFKT